MNHTDARLAFLKASVSHGFIRAVKPQRVEVKLPDGRCVWVDKETAKRLREKHRTT